jgi:hypothetical protein
MFPPKKKKIKGQVLLAKQAKDTCVLIAASKKNGKALN